MKKITVNASKKYDILIDRGILSDCGELIKPLTNAQKIAVVTDDIVDSLYSDTVVTSLEKSGFTTVKYVFPNGEKSKTHTVLLDLYNFLSENDITRTDILIALGGGVVGDLAGFCAATYLRGIEYVQIPTTLLAQVDSSVGGKTAVDIQAGKNLIGAFKQPLLVIADTDTLSTLSKDFFSDGMGEVVKYGMIRSASLFDTLYSGNVKPQLTDIISECVEIKRDVVENDEFDTGERMILNFGHTLGHAIEKHLNFGGISHGKGVAIGMALMTQAAEKNGNVSRGTFEKLKSCLIANNLPYATDIPLETLYNLSCNDKKRTSDKIRIVICNSIGKAEIKTLTLSEYKDFLGI